MTQQYQFEKVEAPRGAFISWGNRAGQHVTGKVITFEPQGGTTRNGDLCPQAVFELVAPAASVNQDGVRIDYPVGELVIVKGDKVQLRNLMMASAMKPGDVVKIRLSGFTSTPNGTAKDFDLGIARIGAGRAHQGQQPAQGGQQAAPQATVAQAAPPAQPQAAYSQPVAQAHQAVSQGQDPWGQDDFESFPPAEPLSDEPPF